MKARKNKYPPKAVPLNFNEKLPELKYRKSTLVNRDKLNPNISARIEMEKLLSPHHKTNETDKIKRLGEAGKRMLYKILSEPSNMDYVIRRDAITALSNYKDADSVLLLVSIINDTNEDEVNAGRALDALAVIGGSGTNKLLMQYYEQGRSEYIKNRALKAIVSGRDKVFIPLLREILEKHKSDYFKIKAYESLRSLGIRVQKPRLKPIPGNKSRVVRSD